MSHHKSISLISLFCIIFLINLAAIRDTECASSSLFKPIPDVKLAKRLPQAIIIGAKKCGTRALIKFIGAHQNVSAANAETHFFDRFYHMGYDWYKQQMPDSFEHQITIEKTPKYLVDKQVAKRVFKMNPNIKLIVVLRNPVTRAVSEYVQSQANKLNLNSINNNNNNINRRRQINPIKNHSNHFQEMLYTVNRTIRDEWPIIRNGLYYEHIKQWLNYFRLDQFLFVNGEQLIKEPSVELDKVQEFLSLSKSIKRSHFVHNKRKGFACIYKPLDSDQIKCLSDQKGRKHPQIDSRVLDDLYSFYRPYNQMLFKLIQQTPWWPI